MKILRIMQVQHEVLYLSKCICNQILFTILCKLRADYLLGLKHSSKLKLWSMWYHKLNCQAGLIFDRYC